MDQEWIHHLPKFGIIPYPASRSKTGTEIAQHKDKSSVLDKVRCELLKIPEQLKKTYFSLNSNRGRDARYISHIEIVIIY